MRPVAALFALSCACGGVRGEVTPAPAPAPAPARDSPVSLDMSFEKTCAAPPAAARPLELDLVTELGLAAGKRWLVARRDGLPVLLHLDATGALAHAPLSRWTGDIALEGDALRLLWAAAPIGWARVDLQDRERPREAPAAALPELVAGAYPKGLASDGGVALVSLYRASGREGGPAHLGETLLLDVATGARIGAPAPMTVWSAHCAGGRCFGVATLNHDDDGPLALVELSAGGARTLGRLDPRQCAGFDTWLEGQQWRIAWSRPGEVGVAAVELDSGHVSTAAIPLSDPACARVRRLVAGEQRGLLVEQPPARAFLALDAGLRPGPLEPLPAFAHDELAVAELGDGALFADFTAAHGVTHDARPDPDGAYEYQSAWSFHGRAGLLRQDADGWSLVDLVELPHHGEHGELADGYRVFLITRPGHGGALVVGDTGLPSAYLPLRIPCPA